MDPAGVSLRIVPGDGQAESGALRLGAEVSLKHFFDLQALAFLNIPIGLATFVADFTNIFQQNPARGKKLEIEKFYELVFPN